ncbi:hypothetical protein niasHT_038652 [Heterodera trifolii]|uniref:C-type lectin domain-containing protein n=1 Tax=Heterodera trifolii TaxID=157864 RepID=A0ABD2I6Z0_9BILA
MRIPIILILLCIVALLIHDACAAGNKKKSTPKRKTKSHTPKKAGNNGTPSKQSVAAANHNKNMPKTTPNEQTPKKTAENGASPSQSAKGKRDQNMPKSTPPNEQTPKKATLKRAEEEEHDDKSIGDEVKDASQQSTPKKIIRAATVGGLLLLSSIAGQPITAGAYDINQDRNSHMTVAEQYKMHGRGNNMAAQRSYLYGETAAATKAQTTHNNFARHTRTKNTPPPQPHKKTLRSPNFSALAAERAKQKKEDEKRMTKNEYNDEFYEEEADTTDVYQAQPKRYNNVPTQVMPKDNFGNSFDENREHYQDLSPTRHGTVMPVKQNSVNPIDKSQLGYKHNRPETYRYDSNPRGVENRYYGEQSEQSYANPLDENERQYYHNRPETYHYDSNQKEDQFTQVDTYVDDGQIHPKITQAPPPPARTQVFHVPPASHQEPTNYNLCGLNWNKFGNHCYLVSTMPSHKPITFDEANKECQQHNPNAQLASIHSPMEEDFVAALTKNRPFRSQKQGQSLYWLAQMKSTMKHTNNDMDGDYGNEGSSGSSDVAFEWSDRTPVDYGNPADKKSAKNFPWYTKPSTKYLENNSGVVMYGKKKDGQNNPWMDEKHTGTWSAISTQSATHGKSVPDVHGYVCKMPTMKATNTHHLNPRAPPNAEEQQQFSPKMAQNFNSRNPTENIGEKDEEEDEEPHFSRNNGNQYGLGPDDEDRRRWP